MLVKEQDSYHAYLLRIWRNGTGAGARWRASLEDPRTGERHGFAGLPEALSFLEAQLRRAADADETTQSDPPH